MTYAVNTPTKLREPTIAAGFAAALVEFAAARGVSRAVLLTEARVSADELASADARLPTAHYVALLETAAKLSGDPALALKFGETVRLEDVSIVGLIGVASATMGEGRAQLNRFAKLIIDEEGSAPEMMELVRDEHGVWLQLTSPNFAAHPMLIEAAFARFVCGVTRSGRSFPLAIHFTHAAPAHIAEYERVFRVPLTFSSDRNALLIDEAFLDIRLPPSNRYVFGLLCERAQALLEDLKSRETVRARVEAALIPILHTGDVAMTSIADKLAMSQSTLYRALRDEGVTYEALVDDLRRTMALHFLDAQRTSINETAYLVGFSEASAFSRAFKRWTGKSPSEYRRSG